MARRSGLRIRRGALQPDALRPTPVSGSPDDAPTRPRTGSARSRSSDVPSPGRGPDDAAGSPVPRAALRATRRRGLGARPPTPPGKALPRRADHGRKHDTGQVALSPDAGMVRPVGRRRDDDPRRCIVACPIMPRWKSSPRICRETGLLASRHPLRKRASHRRGGAGARGRGGAGARGRGGAGARGRGAPVRPACPTRRGVDARPPARTRRPRRRAGQRRPCPAGAAAERGAPRRPRVEAS
jgi:hypothetical protein